MHRISAQDAIRTLISINSCPRFSHKPKDGERKMKPAGKLFIERESADALGRLLDEEGLLPEEEHFSFL
jgi:hypothetical protein